MLSDVHMPDMDGFKLLEIIQFELALPVLMMSANSDSSVVLRGIIHGAVDYLLKPVRIEELRNIWQHVVRRDYSSAKSSGSEDVEASSPSKRAKTSGSNSKSEEVDRTASEMSSGKARKKPTGKKGGKSVKEAEKKDVVDNSNSKKPRVVWSAELHAQFVTAVNQLGIDKAVPKRILDLMGVQGLTRENVASHLQKYRLYLKRLQGNDARGGGMRCTVVGQLSCEVWRERWQSTAGPLLLTSCSCEHETILLRSFLSAFGLWLTLVLPPSKLPVRLRSNECCSLLAAALPGGR